MTLLNLFIAVMQLSYYLTLFSFIPLGIIFRFLIVMKNNTLTKGEKALVIFDFTSFSFFYLLREKSKFTTLYQIFLLIYFVFAFFAFGFGIHMYI